MRALLLLVVFSILTLSCQEMADKPKPKPALENSGLKLSPQQDFSGTYNVVNDSTYIETCNFSITLKEETTGYSYRLTTDKRNIKGNASFQQEDSGALITLEGITWDEYEGDISNDENTQTEELQLPEGVGIMVKNDTIHIQNSGNAMNSYTIFAECGKKFIVLAKQKRVK